MISDTHMRTVNSSWDYPVHRDYRSSGHTTVKIFDDKIEFFNQGKLPQELSIEMMKSRNYRSHPRNLQIADVFKSANIIEKYSFKLKGLSKHLKSMI